MTAIKKSSRSPKITKSITRMCHFYETVKCFLTTKKLSPTSYMFLFETTSILLFMNIMHSFIWYLIQFDQIVLCTVSEIFVMISIHLSVDTKLFSSSYNSTDE